LDAEPAHVANTEIMMRRTLSLPVAFFVATILGGASACSDNADQLLNAPDEGNAVVLVGVTPAGGTSGVDPNSHIVLEFDHPMVGGMEQFCSVHVGGLDGSEVPGHWEWSSDHHTLTFVPDQPLASATNHLLHVGGSLVDAHGHDMDFEQHGEALGGHWVDQDMVGHGGGMMEGHNHSGEGWQHQNGTFGMAFEFTTGV
jgi:hypothetical protein